MRTKVIKAILSFIEENKTAVSIEQLVKFSGYSRRTIHGLFIEYVGMSAGAYVRSRKFCNAAIWLRLTSMSCLRISLELGFSCQQSFSREFKRYFGMSPRDYRNSDIWDMSLLLPPCDWEKQHLRHPPEFLGWGGCQWE